MDNATRDLACDMISLGSQKMAVRFLQLVCLLLLIFFGRRTVDRHRNQTGDQLQDMNVILFEESCDVSVVEIQDSA